MSLIVAVALASCSGGSASLPVTTGDTTALAPLGFASTVTPMAAVNTSPGKVNGLDNQFSPTDGDTPDGGQGKIVDKKVPCLPTMGNGYHVHVFLGIVYHGQLISVPDTIGMVHAGPEINGFTDSAQCFYEIHTHDASGIVHLEVAQPHPLSSVVFHLRSILDVWGVTHGKHSFGPFKGKVRVFTGMPAKLGQTTVSSYTQYRGDKWTEMGLHSHEVIWIQIGKPYFRANQLPPVTFYMEY